MNTCTTCEYYDYTGESGPWYKHCRSISQCSDMDCYIGIDWTEEEKKESYMNRYPNL